MSVLSYTVGVAIPHIPVRPDHLARAVQSVGHQTRPADAISIAVDNQFPQHFGKPWDPANPRQTTICCLWKREALVKVDGFPEPTEETVDADGNRMGEDFSAVARLNELGGRIVHVPERLFLWHHWCVDGRIGNTSGRADHW